jgi:hypothetical protein
VCGQTAFVFAKGDFAKKEAGKIQNEMLQNRDNEMQLAERFDLLKNEMLAGKPTIERVPIDDEFIDQACGFDTDIRISGTAFYITYTDTKGTYHEFMGLAQGRVELTNLMTGTSVVFNISGPGKTEVNPDGSFRLIGTGPWIWFDDPDTHASGYFHTNGRFIFSIDAEGNRTFSRTGTKFNICTVL